MARTAVASQATNAHRSRPWATPAPPPARPPAHRQQVPTSVQPPHLRARMRRQRLFISRILNFDQHLCLSRRRERLQHGADGWHRRLVASQQVPIGGWTRRVDATRAGDHERVTHACLFSPGRTRANPVQHDVELELEALGIEATRGVDARRRAPLRPGSQHPPAPSPGRPAHPRRSGSRCARARSAPDRSKPLSSAPPTVRRTMRGVNAWTRAMDTLRLGGRGRAGRTSG